MKFIIGKKLDMTQLWQGDNIMAVTRVQAGPCTVVQVKTDDKDGYTAIQVGYGEKKEKNIAKPQQGHMKNAGVKARFLREFRIAIDTPKDAKEHQLKVGDKIDVNIFETGDNVQVTGISKGKGFQGVVKRHGFHGQDKTHGTKDQLRMPGSIGATGPAHVFKGVRMPGRMGGDRVTVKGLEIIEVDKENNILLIKGAVPGARNGLVLIQGEGELEMVVAGNEKKKITKEQENAEILEHKNIKAQKHENKIIEDVKKVENKETFEDIEKVAVEAADKQEKLEKQENKK